MRRVLHAHSLTSQRGVLGEDVSGSGPKHDEDVDDSALGDPAHVRLWRLAGALNVVQHLPEHGLHGREEKRPTHSGLQQNTPGSSSCHLTVQKRESHKEDGGLCVSHLSSGVGADVHPGLCGIQPEEAHGALGTMGQHDRYRSVEGHGVIQLVLEDVQIIQPVGISTTRIKYIYLKQSVFQQGQLANSLL